MVIESCSEAVGLPFLEQYAGGGELGAAEVWSEWVTGKVLELF